MQQTTAIALTWAWYELARRSDAEARLVAEVDEVLGGRAPTVADVPRLRYAEAVFSESVRLYPPLQLLGRLAIRDCDIGGYRVRKGTTVLLSPWVIQRDPRFFETPDDFAPERWDDGTLMKGIPKFAYFPFGGGQRLCIGYAFATMEAVLLLATIARRFRLELAPGQTAVPLPMSTLRPNGGLPMTLRRRERHSVDMLRAGAALPE